MKAGGRGILITTLPSSFFAHSSFSSLNTYTLYPGTGRVTDPGNVGSTFPQVSKFGRLAEIGHPVSVYHQVSLIMTCGKCLLIHLIVSGSHLSPTKLNVCMHLISCLTTCSPS